MTPARSAFTLMELLVTMLLIITILAFGVPALFSSERKAGVSDGIRNLVNLHERAMKYQRLAAVTGVSLNYTVVISGTNADLRVSGTSILTVPINGDGVVASVTINSGLSGSTITYDSKSGFPSNLTSSPAIISFKTTNGKYTRLLKIYPLGFTEDVQ